MITIEDIRNPKRKSGFQQVNYFAKMFGKSMERFMAYEGGGRGGDWRGPLRMTAEEAAQDYCDHMNGREVAATRRKRVRKLVESVVEGSQREVTRTTRQRVRRTGPLAQQRRALCNDTCEACNASTPLPESGKTWTQTHHPHAIRHGERETRIDDIVMLCPTCHWIADEMDR